MLTCQEHPSYNVYAIQFKGRLHLKGAMTTSKLFYDLHMVDRDIASRRGGLADVRARLENNQALLFAQAQLEQAQGRDSEIRSRQTELDMQSQTYSEKISDLEKKLYSGAISNPRELSGYQKELQLFKSQHLSIEDSLLQVMGEREESQGSLKESRGEVERLGHERAQEVSRLQEEEGQLVGELETLASQRGAATTRVQPADLSLYERLLKSTQGTAVAKVERGMCLGCRITLPTKELQQVRNGRSLVLCNSCGRILHVI